MSMNDLFNAFNMFTSGVNQLAQGTAIRSANQQVAELRAADMDEAERNLQLKQLAMDTTARLSALGTPVSQTQNLVNQFEPKAPLPVQSPFQGLLSSDPEIRKVAQAYIKQEQDFELSKFQTQEQARIARIDKGLEQKSFDQLSREIEQFNKRPDVKATKTALSKVRTNVPLAKELKAKFDKRFARDQNINVSKLEESERTTVEMLQRDILTLTGGQQRVTDEQLKRIGFTQSFIQRFGKGLNDFFTESPTNRSVEVALQVYEQALNHQANELQNQGMQFFTSKQDVFKNIADNQGAEFTPEWALSRILGEDIATVRQITNGQINTDEQPGAARSLMRGQLETMTPAEQSRRSRGQSTGQGRILRFRPEN